MATSVTPNMTPIVDQIVNQTVADISPGQSLSGVIVTDDADDWTSP